MLPRDPGMVKFMSMRIEGCSIVRGNGRGPHGHELPSADLFPFTRIVSLDLKGTLSGKHWPVILATRVGNSMT